MYRSGIPVVAGGVVGTLLDCHTGAAVLNAVGTRDGRTPYVDGDPWVTKSYTVEFRRPTPLNRRLHLAAEISDLEDDRAHVIGSINVDGEASPPPRPPNGDVSNLVHSGTSACTHIAAVVVRGSARHLALTLTSRQA